MTTTPSTSHGMTHAVAPSAVRVGDSMPYGDATGTVTAVRPVGSVGIAITVTIMVESVRWVGLNGIMVHTEPIMEPTDITRLYLESESVELF